jgi:anaerobic magnesium-protoporphyrin IX monomethyl ester cyclase
MPSVLVAHSYFLRFDPKQAERARPYPPLATLQVAALLQGLGHEVSVFDAMLADGVDEFATQLTQQQPAVVLLYEDNYNYLSKMCLARMREAALAMVRLARAHGAQVIAAGSDVSDEPEVYLRAGVAAVCRGEGLDAIPTLIQRLVATPGPSAAALVQGLDGALAWQQDRLLRGEAAAVVQMRAARRGSDTLEAPVAWELVDLARYREVWQPAHGHFSLNMAASKGCSFRCAWCAKPIWGQRYQQRSPEAVAAEMLMLRQRFGPDHI